MRNTIFTMFLALGWAGSSWGAVCDNGPRPAATLLLPYFEVDLDDPLGIDTLALVRNTSAGPVLVHTTVYSDLAVPVADFNMYFEAHAQISLGMRDLIVNGVIPSTPPGIFSSCVGQLPPPPMPTNFINHLQRSLTGQPSPILGGLCAGRPLGDNVARGYLVMDTVNNCTLRFAGDFGYFGPGGTGDVTNQNVLAGNYIFATLDKKQRSYGGPLVHVEASGSDPETSTPGQSTFYGRYVNWAASDNREPLPTTFSIPLRNVTPISTDLLVWRSPPVSQGAFVCPAQVGWPFWYPLGQERAVAFDSSGAPEVLTGELFPSIAQRVRVGSPELPITTSEGWLYLSLNTTTFSFNNNPPEDPAAASGWVTAIWADGNRFTVGLDGTALDNGCQALHSHP